MGIGVKSGNQLSASFTARSLATVGIETKEYKDKARISEKLGNAVMGDSEAVEMAGYTHEPQNKLIDAADITHNVAAATFGAGHVALNLGLPHMAASLVGAAVKYSGAQWLGRTVWNKMHGPPPAVDEEAAASAARTAAATLTENVLKIVNKDPVTAAACIEQLGDAAKHADGSARNWQAELTPYIEQLFVEFPELSAAYDDVQNWGNAKGLVGMSWEAAKVVAKHNWATVGPKTLAITKLVEGAQKRFEADEAHAAEQAETDGRSAPSEQNAGSSTAVEIEPTPGVVQRRSTLLGSMQRTGTNLSTEPRERLSATMRGRFTSFYRNTIETPKDAQAHLTGAFGPGDVEELLGELQVAGSFGMRAVGGLTDAARYMGESLARRSRVAQGGDGTELTAAEHAQRTLSGKGIATDKSIMRGVLEEGEEIVRFDALATAAMGNKNWAARIKQMGDAPRAMLGQLLGLVMNVDPNSVVGLARAYEALAQKHVEVTLPFITNVDDDDLRIVLAVAMAVGRFSDADMDVLRRGGTLLVDKSTERFEQEVHEPVVKALTVKEVRMENGDVWASHSSNVHAVKRRVQEDGPEAFGPRGRAVSETLKKNSRFEFYSPDNQQMSAILNRAFKGVPQGERPRGFIDPAEHFNMQDGMQEVERKHHMDSESLMDPLLDTAEGAILGFAVQSGITLAFGGIFPGATSERLGKLGESVFYKNPEWYLDAGLGGMAGLKDDYQNQKAITRDELSAQGYAYNSHTIKTVPAVGQAHKELMRGIKYVSVPAQGVSAAAMIPFAVPKILGNPVADTALAYGATVVIGTGNQAISGMMTYTKVQKRQRNEVVYENTGLLSMVAGESSKKRFARTFDNAVTDVMTSSGGKGAMRALNFSSALLSAPIWLRLMGPTATKVLNIVVYPLLPSGEGIGGMASMKADRIFQPQEQRKTLVFNAYDAIVRAQAGNMGRQQSRAQSQSMAPLHYRQDRNLSSKITAKATAAPLYLNKEQKRFVANRGSQEMHESLRSNRFDIAGALIRPGLAATAIVEGQEEA